MNPKTIFIFTLLLFVLCVVVSTSCLTMAPYEKGYSITNVVEDSDLVVYGEVVEKEYVLREGVVTDITIEVKETIKGEPNAAADRVEFTLPGGEFINPKTGESVVSRMAGDPEFELKERVLLFLVKEPHSEYAIFRVNEGKWLVKGGEVPIWYTLGHNTDKVIHLPIDVVIQIGKAAVKDPQATRQLEEEIKAHILLFEKLTNRLKREAKAIEDMPKWRLK